MPPHAKLASNKENNTSASTNAPRKKSYKKSKSIKLKSTLKQAKWSATDDATFTQVLTDQQAAGNQADNAWKGSIWQAVAQVLAGSKAISGGAPKTPSKCHTPSVKYQFSFKVSHSFKVAAADGFQKNIITNLNKYIKL